MKVFYIDQKKSHPYIKEDSLTSSETSNITTHLPLRIIKPSPSPLQNLSISTKNSTRSCTHFEALMGYHSKHPTPHVV
jgi:hypothetical protein